MTTTADPRERLGGTARLAGDEDGIAAPEVLALQGGAAVEGPGARTWAARGQNFVLVRAELEPGAVLPWDDALGHVVIALADDAAIEVAVGGEAVRLEGRGIVTVPPGASELRAHGTGAIARMHPAASTAAAALAQNTASYEHPHPRVRQVEPAAGEVRTLRAHRLADFPNDGSRFGTIFRTETLMVNVLDDQEGPRDTERLSPHHHDDFEQGSFTLEGSWIHHIRTPWTKRMSRWRDDDRIEVDGAALTIIPPPTVHTSRAVGAGTNRMIDLFSPARDDFEAQGWVVNADDYADR